SRISLRSCALQARPHSAGARAAPQGGGTTMKVTGIETLHCDAGWRNYSFVKLTTDEGIVGWSEYDEGFGSPGVTAAIEQLAERVVGQDVSAHERIYAELYCVTRPAAGALGHEVRLMPAQYVKAYIKRNKHDAADAEAICEAVGRPTMRFVPVKTADPQAAVLLHRGRERLVRQRTGLVNVLRGHLAEFGVIVVGGISLEGAPPTRQDYAETASIIVNGRKGLYEHGHRGARPVAVSSARPAIGPRSLPSCWTSKGGTSTWCIEFVFGGKVLTIATAGAANSEWRYATDNHRIGDGAQRCRGVRLALGRGTGEGP